MKKYIFLVCIGLYAWSCQGRSSSEGTGTETETNQVPATTPEDRGLVSSADHPVKIKWLEESFDFGEVEEGTVVEHSFTFVNIGREPLLIKDASAACGCTIPNPPTEPIQAGDTAAIVVNFNSQGRLGPQNKEITVTSNASPSLNTLVLKGVVQSKG